MYIIRQKPMKIHFLHIPLLVFVMLLSRIDFRFLFDKNRKVAVSINIIDATDDSASSHSSLLS